MASSPTLFFGPYRLECQSGTLWRDEQPIVLRSQTLALLQYLAERPGDVISISELQQYAWQGEHVTTSVFRVTIHELRQALQDDIRNPQYIETVRGRGYCFCARVSTADGNVLQNAQTIIGRGLELRQLQDGLARARHGQRQLVLVSGEAGMGKTTLVDAFLETSFDGPDLIIGRGYCIEHHGAAEAYLPILQALGHLGQSTFREPLVQALQQAAPTWLRQLPVLIPPSEREHLALDTSAATRVRMIRELVDALNLLSAQQLVVLVLEDLHWSDPSTIDLMSAIMRRMEPARLLLLGTYRPLELQVQAHALFDLLQEAQGHGYECDVRLTPWTADVIKTFLARHLPGSVGEDLAAMLYQRSDGNPLFLSRLFDYLKQRELLIDINGQWQLLDETEAYQALPDGVRQLLHKQIDQLPERVQEVLKIASVAGMRFATALVTAEWEAEAGLADESLTWAASRSYFLQAQGVETWPDGTISGQYQFGHALYRQVLYDRLSAERRVKLHRLMGERLERAYIENLEPVTGLLAYHFAQGLDVSRALYYLHEASVRALRRFAAKEAISLLTTALELLPGLPPEHDRAKAEYPLQATLGTAIVSARGARMPEATTAYQRAYQLGQSIGDIDQFFPTLVGLENMAISQADYARSQHLGGQLFNYAQITHDPLHLAHAFSAMGINHAMRAQYLPAHDYIDRCGRLSLSPGDLRHHPSFTLDPILLCQRWDVHVLIDLGYPDQAVALSQVCMARAQELGDPFSMQQAFVANVIAGLFCYQPSVLYETAQAMVAYAERQGQEFWEAGGTIVLACAMARLGRANEGLSPLESALATFRATGYRHSSSFILNMAAEAYYGAGRIEVASALLQEIEAFIDETGEHFGDSVFYGLRGRLLQDAGNDGEAEVCFVRALALARQRHAKGAELRAAMQLSRLWQAQGEWQKARDLLLPVYNWFTEGFDTAELQAAKALLDQLA